MRPITFVRFTAEILALNSPPMRAAGTRRQLRQVLQEFAALPAVRRTSDLRPSAIAAWIAAHPSRSPVRTASLLRSLSSACKYAVSEGYLRQSPFSYRRVNEWVRVQVTASDHPRPNRHISAQDVGRLLAYLDDQAAGGGWKTARLRALIYLVAYSGLRRSEALHLRVSDIDLDRRVVMIQPRKDCRLKTRSSAATLPLAAPLQDVLEVWLQRCGSDWVFPGTRLRNCWTGGPPGHKPLDAVRRAGEAVGINGLTFMSFRKTLGTLAKAWGLGQLELRALLRHSNIETQRWYDEEATESLRETVSKIQFRIIGAQA